MNLQERINWAMQGKDKGYTCCQCVVCAFFDLLDTDTVDMFKMAEGFGGGVGGLMEICGVVSAMTMMTGLQLSSGSLEENTSKEDSICVTGRLANEFKEISGSLLCRELRGVDTGEPLRDCDLCIQDGIRIIAKEFFPQLL